MFNFFNKKTFNKVIGVILNSKITYIVLLLIVVLQFVLISAIYVRLSAIKPCPEMTLEQMKATIDKISSQQNLQNEKLNSLQSNLMMIQSQMYRTQQ